MNLAAALIGHMVGDYLLQNDWMAANKTASSFICGVHAALWTAAVCLFGLVPLELLPGAVAWLFGTHWVIDRFALARRSMDYTGQGCFKRGALAPWSIVAVDNSWHLVTIWALWLFAR